MAEIHALERPLSTATSADRAATEPRPAASHPPTSAPTASSPTAAAPTPARSATAAPVAMAAPAVVSAVAVDQRDPWRQQRALQWTDVTTAEQARRVLHGRCEATGRPWVLPTEPDAYRAADGSDVIDDHVLWICQRLLGLGHYVERVRNWRDPRRAYHD